MTECGLKNYYYKKRCDESHTFFLSILLAFIVCRLLEKIFSGAVLLPQQCHQLVKMRVADGIAAELCFFFKGDKSGSHQLVKMLG